MSAERPQSYAPRSPVRGALYRMLLTSAHGLFRAGNGFLLLAAGLLRFDELRTAAVEQYRSFNISEFDVDAGLTLSEDAFYTRFLRKRDRILLAGCGTGRDLIALRQRGYDVAGLEPVPEVVALAQQHLARHGLSAPVHTGLIQSAELNGFYDAVVFSNGCYSLLQGAALRIATLSRVAAHLTPSGRIIISYQPANRRSLYGLWLTRAAAVICRSDWTPEPGDMFSPDPFVPRLIRYQHVFAPAEFSRECDAAGLALLVDEMLGDGHRLAAAERRS
jgi:SAM-dependent methyltransferase